MRVRLLLASALTLAVFALQAVPAPAAVPTRGCGFMRDGGQRYEIRAGHRLRCKAARTYARRYLRRNRTPKGYTCLRRPDPDIALYCSKGRRRLLYVNYR